MSLDSTPVDEVLYVMLPIGCELGGFGRHSIT